MLMATFKDANITLVHLATVICDRENSDNYSWLYKLMKKNADMESVLDSARPPSSLISTSRTSLPSTPSAAMSSRSGASGTSSGTCSSRLDR